MIFDHAQLIKFISSDIDEMIFMLSDAPVRSHDPILLTTVYTGLCDRVKCVGHHEYQQCLHQELVDHPS